MGRGRGQRVMYARVQSSDYPLNSCGVLGKWFALSEPIFSVVKWGY